MSISFNFNAFLIDFFKSALLTYNSDTWKTLECRTEYVVLKYFFEYYKKN